MRRFLGQHIFSSLTRRILVPQLGRPGRPGHRHPLSQPVPRRADRCPRRKPDDAGRDHRRRDRRVGDGRDRFDHASIPEKLLAAAGRREPGAGSDQLDNLEFPINPERVAPVLRRLMSPTRTRARIYDRDGQSAARFAPSLFARPDPALRPAAGRGRAAGHAGAGAEIRLRFLPQHATCPSITSSPAAMARPSRKWSRR